MQHNTSRVGVLGPNQPWATVSPQTWLLTLECSDLDFAAYIMSNICVLSWKQSAVDKLRASSLPIFIIAVSAASVVCS